MRKLFIIFALLAPALGLNAQVLLPTPHSAFEPKHNFNPEIIRRNNIRKITFDIIDKKDFEVAIDRNLVETYEFNANGLLSRYFYTTIRKTVEREIIGRRGRVSTTTDYLYDTISTTYIYSADNKLLVARNHDGHGYYEARYYHYDADGLLTREVRYRETNASPDPSLFILGNHVLISEDSLQYQKFSSGQIKCTLLNNENRPYKERIINKDQEGRWSNVSEFYTAAAWIAQKYQFAYNSGRLTSATFEGNAETPFKLNNTYEYDSNQELYTEKQYRNETLLKEISYVSDRNNGLLNSFVVRDPLSKSIRIVKLRYDFGLIGKSEN